MNDFNRSIDESLCKIQATGAFSPLVKGGFRGVVSRATNYEESNEQGEAGVSNRSVFKGPCPPRSPS